MITLEDAQSKLFSRANTLEAEQVTLDQCYNRILAQDVLAAYDFPPFARSPLDGFAVRFADVRFANPETPVPLKVIDQIPAGTVSAQTVVPGTAMRIMTGAPIPAGADAVVRLEDTESGAEMVEIRAGAGSDRSICAQGEEIASGEKVLAAGTRIDANSIGLLAMFGISCPFVYKRPRVGILSTGSEIVSLSDPLAPGKIRDTNSHMLQMELLEAGAEPVMLGRVRDEIADIVNTLKQAPACDLILTTGGASVGDYDLIGAVYDAIGAELLFSRVAIKPGMPVLAGAWHSCLLIGLSGNPAAASVSYKLLVRPLIKKLGGTSQTGYMRAKAKLSEVFLKPSPTRRFVWGRYQWDEPGLSVLPLLHQGNGMLRSRPGANCLIDIPAGSAPLEPGAMADIWILE